MAFTRVERAFWTLQASDLQVRPIHLRLTHWERSHIFVFLLVYNVEWHLREGW